MDTFLSPHAMTRRKGKGACCRAVVERRYEVPVEIPAEAAGRRVAVSFDLVNTRADVFLDGEPAGTCVFPCGWNFVIADNYNFRPGCLAATEGFLSACDDTGLLCSFTLPSLNDFDEAKLRDDPETQRVFRELTRQAVRMARRHPSVIFYAMNHNRLGYAGDMDPLRIGVGYRDAPVADDDPYRYFRW